MANDEKDKKVSPKKKGVREFLPLIVSVIIIGLLVGLLLWQRNREPEDDGEIPYTPTQIIRLVDRTEDEILKVVFQGEETITMLPFEDENGHTQWTQEGVDYIFNHIMTRNRIRAAFNIFSSQIIHEDINEVPGLNLDDFGFNKVVMTAYYTDGTTINLYLGGPTADLSGHFFMVEGNPALYTISMPNAQRFTWGVEDLLDTFLPEWVTDPIDHLLIAERDRNPIEFIRDSHPDFPDLDWLIMNQPFHGHEIFVASFDAHVMGHFSAFTIGDLVNVDAADLSPYGLDNPSLEFIYVAPHGEAHLLFGDVFFKDVDGEDTAFIYVMFAGRPHVFETLYAPVQVIFNMNVLRFIERFVAIMDIQTVERIDISTLDTEYVIYINHVGDRDIEPTVNDIPVDVSDFRTVYRMLIGLSINAEIEQFTPTDEPVFTVLYTRTEDEEDVYLRFYPYDDHFLAVSVDGEEAWYVITLRSFELFLTYLEALM